MTVDLLQQPSILQGSTLIFDGPGSVPPVLPGSTASQPHRVIDIQGPAHLAQPLTVTGGVIVVGDPGNPDWILRAQWAAYGWRTSAEIDLVRGTVFTVFANSLQVDVLATDPDNEAGHSGTVGAFVAYGVRTAPARPPTRTFRLIDDGGGSATIAPGGISNAVAIPAYARDVFLLSGQNVSPGADQSYALIFDNSTGSQLTKFRGQNGVFASQIAIPIPNDADTCFLENIGAANIDHPRLIFGLAL